jgi:hypothetical protein
MLSSSSKITVVLYVENLSPKSEARSLTTITQRILYEAYYTKSAIVSWAS